MKQYQKQNQKLNPKLNPKLIFLGTLLLVITVAFIFASGCIDEDTSIYIPVPSAPPDIVLTKPDNQGVVSGGYTDFTDDYYIPPPASR